MAADGEATFRPEMQPPSGGNETEDLGNLPERLLATSRALSLILRHQAIRVGLRPRGEEGWCELDEVLKVGGLQGCTAEDIKEIVRGSYAGDQPRFELEFEDDRLWVRATSKRTFHSAAVIPPRAAQQQAKQHEKQEEDPWVAAAGSAGGAVASRAVASRPGGPHNGSCRGHTSNNFGGHGGNAPGRRNGVAEFKTIACRDFLGGSCQLGDTCRFSHQESNGAHVPAVVQPRVIPPRVIPARQQKALPPAAAHGVVQVIPPRAPAPARPPQDSAAREVDARYKTSMCPHFKRGNCEYAEYCKFAHGLQELRPLLVPGVPSAARGAASLSNGSHFRTRICPHFPQGRCTYGDACKFAHSSAELRSSTAKDEGPASVSTVAALPQEPQWEPWEEVVAAAAAAASASVAPPIVEDVEPPAAQVEEAQAPEPKWQKFQGEGDQGCWWWRESDGDYFLEDEPGDWVKYADSVEPGQARAYWWKDDENWFWDHTGDKQA